MQMTYDEFQQEIVWAHNDGLEAAARLIEQTEKDIGSTRDEFAKAIRELKS